MVMKLYPIKIIGRKYTGETNLCPRLDNLSVGLSKVRLRRPGIKVTSYKCISATLDCSWIEQPALKEFDIRCCILFHAIA